MLITSFLFLATAALATAVIPSPTFTVAPPAVPTVSNTVTLLLSTSDGYGNVDKLNSYLNSASNAHLIIGPASPVPLNGIISFSNVQNSIIEIQAQLQFSSNLTNYINPANPTPGAGHSGYLGPLFGASNLQTVVIKCTNGGGADGAGFNWWTQSILNLINIYTSPQCTGSGNDCRPRLFSISGSNDLTFQDLHLTNSPTYHLELNENNRVLIQGLTVYVDLTLQQSVWSDVRVQAAGLSQLTGADVSLQSTLTAQFAAYKALSSDNIVAAFNLQAQQSACSTTQSSCVNNCGSCDQHCGSFFSSGWASCESNLAGCNTRVATCQAGCAASLVSCEAGVIGTFFNNVGHLIASDVIHLQPMLNTLWTSFKSAATYQAQLAILTTVNSLPTYPLNTDGIDPSGHDYMIVNYNYTGDDDAIAVKPLVANNIPADCTSRVIVNGAVINRSTGMAIGTIPNHNKCIDSVLFNNVTFTNPYKAIYVKSDPDTGFSVATNIWYTNFNIYGAVWWPIAIGPNQQIGRACSFFYPLGACAPNPTGNVTNLYLNNINIQNSLWPFGGMVIGQAPYFNNFVWQNVSAAPAASITPLTTLLGWNFQWLGPVQNFVNVNIGQIQSDLTTKV